jgi:cytochrome c oxidase subunit 2
MTLVHLLMLVLFVGWGTYFTFVLFRFRRARNPRANPDGARGRFALATEIGVVIAEAVLLVIFALPLWFDRTSAQPTTDGAVVIRVVAEQFAWNVHYPGADGRFGETKLSLVTPTNPLGLDRQSPFGKDDIVLISQMHLPVNRPVIVQLSSKDVIHSFGVPEFRVKQDAIPGLTIPIWFIPNVTTAEMRTRTGKAEFQYEIACAQLCGLGHAAMRGFVTVQTAEEFQKWFAEQVAAQSEVDPFR